MNDEHRQPAFLERSWFSLILLHTFILQGLILILRVATTYRALEVGLDAFWIGVIGGAFGVLPALLGLHLGKVIDRGGETMPLRFGSALVLTSAVLFWLLADNLTMLIICSVILGFGQFTCIAGEHSAIARCAPEGQHDLFFGRFTVAISIAQAIAPSCLSFFGHDALVPETGGIFLMGSVTALTVMVTAMFIRLPAHPPEQDRTGVWQTTLILVKGRGFGLSVLSGLVIFSAIDLLVIYLPLFGAERGISAGLVGNLLALRAVASIASRLMFGRLITRLGRGPLLILAMLVAGAGIALLPITSLISLMAVGLFAAGLGLGIGAPLTLGWVTEISPLGMRATALSLRLAANRVGQALLPIGVGAAVAGIGASGVLWATSATLGISAALAARYFRVWWR